MWQGQQSDSSDVRRCSAELRRLHRNMTAARQRIQQGERGEEVPAPRGEETAKGGSHAELTSPPPLLSVL